MAGTISSSTQLSTFDTIKTILKTSSDLTYKFKDSSYYQFEPNFKSLSAASLPLIVINVPQLEDQEEFLGNTSREKEFEVNIQLYISYHARDKYLTYANAIIKILEDSQSTFKSNGYDLQKVDIDDIPQVVTLKDKQMVIGNTVLILEGEIR